jgi:hypothetical protein
MEAVMKRLNSLPWTLTRKASYKRAYRLAKLLESLGGTVHCEPPLPSPTRPVMDETLILPSAELISQTQIMSPTQFVAPAEEPHEAEAPPAATVTHATARNKPAEPAPSPMTEPSVATPSTDDTLDRAPQGFFSKHKETILILILSTVVTLGCVWFGLYALDRLGIIH